MMTWLRASRIRAIRQVERQVGGGRNRLGDLLSCDPRLSKLATSFHGLELPQYGLSLAINEETGQRTGPKRPS
jgi:hypothetical protein